MPSPLVIVTDHHPYDFLLYAIYAALKTIAMIGIAIIVNYWQGRLAPLW